MATRWPCRPTPPTAALGVGDAHVPALPRRCRCLDDHRRGRHHQPLLGQLGHHGRRGRALRPARGHHRQRRQYLHLRARHQRSRRQHPADERAELAVGRACRLSVPERDHGLLPRHGGRQLPAAERRRRCRIRPRFLGLPRPRRHRRHLDTHHPNGQRARRRPVRHDQQLRARTRARRTARPNRSPRPTTPATRATPPSSPSPTTRPTRPAR